MLDPSGHFAYQITKADKPEDSTMGKLVMTGAGDIPASFEINGVPSMRIRIGSPNDNDWSVREVGGRLVSLSGPIQGLGNDGMVMASTLGTYYQLMPTTNGYLRIDANLSAKNVLVLIGKDAAGNIVKETYTPDIDTQSEYQFAHPLIAGQTYYLYNEGDGLFNYGLELHGLNFDPAFIRTREDLIAVERASVFMNGYTGGLPHLLEAVNSQVTFESTNSGVAEVGEYTGVVSKAYVRYALHVKAGKTYYVFQKGSKLGFCGFAFVPEGWTPESGVDRVRVKADAVTLSGKDAYKVPGDIENAEVTLLRKFKKDYWTTICLPFSVQETEFKKIFGENAVICTFDKIIKLNLTGEEQNVLHLRQHVYHMIEAGVPYFLKSAVDLEQVVFSKASFESHIQPEFFYSAQMDGFQSKGIYSPTKLPEYSYILNGQFTRRTGGYLLNGYRAYLENLAGAAGDLTTAAGAKLMPFSGFDDLTTGIDDIVMETGDTANPYTNGVLDLQGRKVADYANAVKQLPKGVYIVNGKKIVVR